MGDEGIELKAPHHSCPTYVLGLGGFRQVRETCPLDAGDHIVAGTTVVGLVNSGAETTEGSPLSLGAT